jgi:flagellar biosynthesis chaperone FliJ
MGKRIDRIRKTGVIAAALAELQKERVKEATVKLKDLYKQRDKARKILRNMEREIEDYLMELEIDDEDAESTN